MNPMNNPNLGPEDLFDPDNYEISSVMADYGHNFEKKSTPAAPTTSSDRWAPSVNKFAIALIILGIAISIAISRIGFGIIIALAEAIIKIFA